MGGSSAILVPSQGSVPITPFLPGGDCVGPSHITSWGDCFFCLQKPVVFTARSPLCTQLLTELEPLLASMVGLPQGAECIGGRSYSIQVPADAAGMFGMYKGREEREEWPFCLTPLPSRLWR